MYEFFELQGCTSDSGTELLYTSYFHDNNRWNGTAHTHGFWEVFFCLEGSCEFFVWDDSFIIHEGDFVIVNPGVEHWENNLGCKWVVVAFNGPQFPFANTTRGYTSGNFHDKTEYVLQLALSLIDEAKQKLAGYQTACSHIFELLMLQINRSRSLPSHDFGEANKIRPAEAKRNSITQIMQYIENNYTKNLNIETLARKIGLNKYSLIREFKQTYGVSPMEHLLRCRFREAKFLLSTTDLSISQIGQGVGFSSGNYFSQCFTKREGMTPTAYRQMQQSRESQT